MTTIMFKKIVENQYTGVITEISDKLSGRIEVKYEFKYKECNEPIRSDIRDATLG